MRRERHELSRCLLVEFSGRLSMRDSIEVGDEICYQLYMDSLGHGINAEFRRER